MTTHITKTWFDGKNLVTQEIPVGEIYKREWVGLTPEDRLCAKYMQDAPNGIEAVIDYIETKLKEKNFD